MNLSALTTVLTTLTNAVGYTLDITSAYRSPDYNASVGGSKKSMHMQGKAVDVIMTGKTDVTNANNLYKWLLMQVSRHWCIQYVYAH